MFVVSYHVANVSGAVRKNVCATRPKQFAVTLIKLILMASLDGAFTFTATLFTLLAAHG